MGTVVSLYHCITQYHCHYHRPATTEKYRCLLCLTVGDKDRSRTSGKMSKVDLVTNKAALEKARDSVVKETADKYVIFSYADSGMSNTLEVEEEEEGDLDSLVTGFHSSRIQYGLVGVETPKGRKHILVIWQGEAPILRKSACAHHVDEVTRFMKPIFTWIAREDDDLDVDLIKNQMTKSSNY